MGIGKVSKQVCSEAGGSAIDCQDHLMAAIRQYFKHNLDYRDVATAERFLQGILPDTTILDDGGNRQLNAAIYWASTSP